jgi:hypothetical protein
MSISPANIFLASQYRKTSKTAHFNECIAKTSALKRPKALDKLSASAGYLSDLLQRSVKNLPIWQGLHLQLS